MIPRQLGPRIRIPSNLRCSARMASSRLRPTSPASRNPAERMMMPGMPFSPHDRTMPGTSGGGVQITARSATAGMLWISA